jgi:hypothetical protein
MWDLWWTKLHWDWFSPNTTVSPCQFSFHRLLYTHHHLSSGAGTIDQFVADVPSGLSLTPPQETKKEEVIFLDELQQGPILKHCS